MKIYKGVRKRPVGGCVVTVDGKRLKPREDLRNHSPTGFEWGYQGSGPAQLALAILADSFGDEMALEAYQHFKRHVIAYLPHEGWMLTEREVRCWYHRYCQAEIKPETQD